MISFIPLGGADEIGANCYYLNLNGRGILLDSGMHPKKNNIEALPLYNLIKNKNIDACIISHAHLDHIGSLPITLRNFPHLHPYMTQATYNLSDIMLHNSTSIIEKESSDLSPFYTHQLVDMATHTFIPKEYEVEFNLVPFQYDNEEKITCKFYDAGHILGAASALISTDNIKIFYTGDISLSSQELIGAAVLPKEPVDILILESTLASTSETEIRVKSKMKESFAKEIRRIINNNGSVLIPVFALGKTQEILAMIWNMMNDNKIPMVDIYTGNMSRKITKLYDVFRYKSREEFMNFEIKNIPQKSFPERHFKNEILNKPSIFLAPSGMVDENTVSYQISNSILGKFNCGIFFVGYLDPDSPGYKISKLKKGDYFSFSDSSAVKNICEIKNFRFTSHSRLSELLKIVKLLKPKIVLLLHGDNTGRTILKNKIELYNREIQVLLPEEGSEYHLDF